MSDNYQAVYDAIRSSFHGCDVGSAIESACREAFGNASHQIACVAQDFSIAAGEHGRPCVVFKPVPSKDGDHFCVLFGPDLVQGVAGFGKSMAEAMADFDKNWYANDGAAKAAA